MLTVDAWDETLDDVRAWFHRSPCRRSRPLMPRRVIEEAKKLNRTGLIQIVIDERGSVEEVLVRQSVTAAYDARVAQAEDRRRSASEIGFTLKAFYLPSQYASLTRKMSSPGAENSFIVSWAAEKRPGLLSSCCSRVHTA